MTDPAPRTSDEALRALLQSYNELNPATVAELRCHQGDVEASEASHHIALNRPFVARGAGLVCDFHKRWDADFLKRLDTPISVAVTPHGNADSIVIQDGERLFVQPLERQMSMADALDHIIQQEKSPLDAKPVYYYQAQNDCLRKELYSSLEKSCPECPLDALESFLKAPAEAINLWLGNSHSVSALHRDNYENFFIQVRGTKRFLLLPPVAIACIGEVDCIPARYQAPDEIASSALVKSDLSIKMDKDQPTVPVPTWDPDVDVTKPGSLRSLIKPLEVILEQGDLLYLPALWYHKVSQTAGEEGFNCSLNYWYDMQYAGDRWSLNNFVRDVARANGSR